jgi:hypothetical protein
LNKHRYVVPCTLQAVVWLIHRVQPLKREETKKKNKKRKKKFLLVSTKSFYGRVLFCHFSETSSPTTTTTQIPNNNTHRAAAAATHTNMYNLHVFSVIILVVVVEGNVLKFECHKSFKTLKWLAIFMRRVIRRLDYYSPPVIIYD